MYGPTDQGWYSDPDYDRDGTLIHQSQPRDPDQQYEAMRDQQRDDRESANSTHVTA